MGHIDTTSTLEYVFLGTAPIVAPIPQRVIDTQRYVGYSINVTVSDVGGVAITSVEFFSTSPFMLVKVVLTRGMLLSLSNTSKS